MISIKYQMNTYKKRCEYFILVVEGRLKIKEISSLRRERVEDMRVELHDVIWNFREGVTVKKGHQEECTLTVKDAYYCVAQTIVLWRRWKVYSFMYMMGETKNRKVDPVYTEHIPIMKEITFCKGCEN